MGYDERWWCSRVRVTRASGYREKRTMNSRRQMKWYYVIYTMCNNAQTSLERDAFTYPSLYIVTDQGQHLYHHCA